jgi:hypothetical protein
MTGRRAAVVMCLLLLAYMAFTFSRAVDFIQAGGIAPVLLGLALLVFPALGAWIIWKELRFGRATQLLGGELAEQGLLPVDDLPRRPSGRVERAAADSRFAEVQDRVQRDPQAWGNWFALSVAYDDAGDRKRARSAMRRAIAMHDGGAPMGCPDSKGTEHCGDQVGRTVTGPDSTA